MRGASKTPQGCELRVGSIEDIDLLCAIDEDASALFVGEGLELNFPDSQEFSKNERDQWLASLACGNVLIAMVPGRRAVGFAATRTLDSQPHLEQLSVLRSFMRMGIGRALLDVTEHAARKSGADSLSLTTYSHLPWNRPFYERAGFAVLSEASCGAEILRVLAYEKHWLPCADRRIAMRKVLAEVA